MSHARPQHWKNNQIIAEKKGRRIRKTSFETIFLSNDS